MSKIEDLIPWPDIEHYCTPEALKYAHALNRALRARLELMIAMQEEYINQPQQDPLSDGHWSWTAEKLRAVIDACREPK